MPSDLIMTLVETSLDLAITCMTEVLIRNTLGKTSFFEVFSYSCSVAFLVILVLFVVLMPIFLYRN